LLPPLAGLRWSNVFTGENVQAHMTAKGQALSLSEIFARLPVALLQAEAIADGRPLTFPRIEETTLGIVP